MMSTTTGRPYFDARGVAHAVLVAASYNSLPTIHLLNVHGQGQMLQSVPTNWDHVKYDCCA